jgi:glycosyltransferase involved in cell wall biosynthesis
VKIAFAYAFDDDHWIGGRNYYSSLISAIEAVEGHTVQITLVTGTKTRTALPAQFPAIRHVRTRLLDRGSGAWALRQVPRALSRWKSDPLLATLLRRNGIDLLSHAWGLGERAPIKSLAWVPDFQFLHFPGFWSPSQLRRTYQLHAATCESATAIVLSSSSALSDLKVFAPTCKLPVHVLHFAPLPIDVSNLPVASAIRAKYKLPERYFHLPGQFWTHKNHRVVVDALAVAKARGLDITVACTGKTDDHRQPDYFGGLMADCARGGVIDNFRVLGMVPHIDAQALMRHAQAVINPSLFEGWSTTVEEAKALGKRTLLSDIPVHREQAPCGGRYFAPQDPEQLAVLLADCQEADWPEPDSTEIARAHVERLRTFGHSYMKIARGI